MHLVGDLKLN